LLADERKVLPRRHAEARAERPAELAGAAKAAALGDLRQRALALVVRKMSRRASSSRRFNNMTRTPPSAAKSR
jgi:hypothetical protein